MTDKVKKKSLLRTEAVAPFVIVAALVTAYFMLFFDLNLKQACQWLGYEIVGAEVDIAEVDTSFVHGTFVLKGLAVTNPDKPDHNMLEIGQIKFAVLWDGLLRAKIVVDEMSVDQIAINTTRKSPGKVKPPAPPAPKTESKVGKDLGKAGEQTLDNLGAQHPDSALSDLAALLSGGPSGELQNLDKTLPSKQMLTDFQKELDEKQKKWQERLKTLPQSKEIQDLSDRIGKVKTSGFTNPAEILQSAQALNAIINEANTKYQSVATLTTDLNQDLTQTSQKFNSINDQIKKDMAGLEGKLHIPKIDSKSLMMTFLFQYLHNAMGKYGRYVTMAEKMVPPSSLSHKADGKTKPAKVEASMVPHAREKGVVYEFGKPHSYPAFWIQKIHVSSKATPNGEVGDLSGEIDDITSNQLLTEKPTVAKLSGGFPAQQISGVNLNLSIDNRGDESKADFHVSVAAYPMKEQQLINSPDAKIILRQAQGSLITEGSLIGFHTLEMKLHNEFGKIDYDIGAQNAVLDSVLKGVFKGIPQITIDAKGQGELPDPSLSVDSNIGLELQKGFAAQIQAKVDELRTKIKAAVDAQIGPQKAQIEGQINQIRNQAQGQLKSVTDQLDKEKAQAQSKIDKSQKSGLQQQGQKAVDDLKKAFGF